MMIGQCHEVLRSDLFVKSNQSFRIPFIGFPDINHIFEAEITRITILRDMCFILSLSGIIHVACIPVTIFRFTLRSPMSPNTELCILKPFWGFSVLFQRFPRGLINTRFYWFYLRILGV